LLILSILNSVNRLAINRQLYIEELPIYKKPKGGALKNEQHDNGNTKTRMDVLDYRQDKFWIMGTHPLCQRAADTLRNFNCDSH